MSLFTPPALPKSLRPPSTSGLGRVVFKSGFEISPIILTNGIASFMPFQVMPIVMITEPMNTVSLSLSGMDPTNLDNFFAHFVPVPGADIVNSQVGTYPFANQSVAANAIITQPLSVSMLMICPVKTRGGYATKLITFIALKMVLEKHMTSGGTFTVLTPTAIYTDCLLLRLSDVSAGQSDQPQYEWQFDFYQPLLTLGAAQQQLNSLMTKVSNNSSFSGPPAWSGTAAPPLLGPS